MIVVLVLLAALFYLYFAGYGISGLLLRSAGSDIRRQLALPLGYAVTIAIYSETVHVSYSPSLGFIVAIGVVCLLNLVYVFRSKHNPESIPLEGFAGHQTSYVRLHLLSLGLVLLLGIAFVYGGWTTYWGSANGDMFDGLQGRDMFFANTKTFFEQEHGFFKDDPPFWYQYSSLAFLSKLFLTADHANVFYLQGLLMLFMTVGSIYFLCRTAFQFSEKTSLLGASLAVINSLYVSTYYTGHEGSLVFGAIAPFMVGLSVWGIRERRLRNVIAALLCLLYCMMWTYPQPLVFLAGPVFVYLLYSWFSGPRDTLMRRKISSIGQRFIPAPGSRTRAILILVLAVLGAFVVYVVVLKVWNYYEPIRTNPTGRLRSWGIAHFKEMMILYWGLTPSPIAFGREGAALRLYPWPALVAAYALCTCYIGLAVAAFWRAYKTKIPVRVFLLSYAFFWVAFFLFMKFIVGDSYYLYKFLYTNLFLTVVLLVYGTLGSREDQPEPEKKHTWKKLAAGGILISYVLSNVVMIAVYNYDLLTRPYNGEASKEYWEVEPLRPYTPQGMLLTYAANNFNSDYGNIVVYIFARRLVPTELPGGRFKYRLTLAGVEDIVRQSQKNQFATKETEWQNGAYRVSPVPAFDLLLPLDRKARTVADDWYQTEKFQTVYGGSPFRWASYKLDFLLSRPSNKLPLLGFVVEPGPGYDFQTFDLQVQILRKEADSSYVRGLYLEDYSRYTAIAQLTNITVTGVQYSTVRLPNLDSASTFIRIKASRKGKDILPWDERYLDYRMAMIGLVDSPYDRDVLRLMNQEKDIVPPHTWSALTDTSTELNATKSLLCVWNHWWPVETYAGQLFRWAANDVELLLLNPTPNARFLCLDLERGPGLRSENSTLSVFVNGQVADTLILTGSHNFKVRLPNMLPKENIVKLHVSKEGESVGNDPRVLNFRVFRAYLSDQ